MCRIMEQKSVSVDTYSLGVFIVVLTGHMGIVEGQTNCRVPGSSSSICSQLDLHGVEFHISGLQPGQQGTGCQCILTFNDSSHVNGPIALNVTANDAGGCQNKVHFVYNSDITKSYDCKDRNPVYIFNVSIQDKLEIILVSNEKSTGGFQFCFKISTQPELNMRLVCNKPSIIEMAPSTTTEMRSDTVRPRSTQTTTDERVTDQNTTVSSTSTTTMEIMSETTVSNTSTTTVEIISETTVSNTSTTTVEIMPGTSVATEIMPDTTVLKSTQSTTDERITDQNTNLTSTDENGDIGQSKLGFIIGGSVGGLTVIIVIIIIILCLIRKRRKEKNYESPEAAETDAHPYQNIPDNRSGEITHPYQNIPDNRSGEITHPYQDIPDNRSGEITHQPKQNNEVVHQENDPYTIIDNDIIKPSNGIQGMEYLENDLYISSDDVTDDMEVDDKPKAQLPVVAEYAQGNKTTNGNCKTGPKGDNYAVVHKGGKVTNNEQFKIEPSGDQYAVVKKEGKKNNGEGGTEFKIGPSGDQYAVVNKMG